MRKIIAAINMTLDGYCDHTGILPDEEIHRHYAELLAEADVILYGRITYQLMEFWKTLISNPSGEPSMDDFALVMDKVSKTVFSQTLENLDWDSARLAKLPPEEEVAELLRQPGGNILVGSRSLIIQLMKLGLVDEFQLCIHPVVAGSGLPLFENATDRINLQLLRTKTFSGGAVILYYSLKNRITRQ